MAQRGYFSQPADGTPSQAQLTLLLDLRVSHAGRWGNLLWSSPDVAQCALNMWLNIPNIAKSC